jgi:hypothetical protein
MRWINASRGGDGQGRCTHASGMAHWKGLASGKAGVPAGPVSLEVGSSRATSSTPSAGAFFYRKAAPASSLPGGAVMFRVSRRGEGINDADTLVGAGRSSANRYLAATTWTRSGPIRSPRGTPAANGADDPASGRVRRGRAVAVGAGGLVMDAVHPNRGPSIQASQVPGASARRFERRRTQALRILCTSSVGTATRVIPPRIAIENKASTPSALEMK